MSICDRCAWRRTLVRGDEVDGRSVGALEHLRHLPVRCRRPVGAGRARLAAARALAARLGRLGVLGLDLGLYSDFTRT